MVSLFSLFSIFIVLYLYVESNYESMQLSIYAIYAT